MNRAYSRQYAIDAILAECKINDVSVTERELKIILQNTDLYSGMVGESLQDIVDLIVFPPSHSVSRKAEWERAYDRASAALRKLALDQTPEARKEYEAAAEMERRAFDALQEVRPEPGPETD